MKLAFYLRLSLADGDLGKNNKDESNSIENQRWTGMLQNMSMMGILERTSTVRHFRQWWKMQNVGR